MTQNKKHFWFAILAGSLLSCKKDFLDVKNTNSVTKEAGVYDLGTTGKYLNGIYVNIAQDLYYYGSFTNYPEIIADNIKTTTATSTFFASQYSWTQRNVSNTQYPISASNENKFWLVGYELIRACSFAVEKSGEYRGEDAVKADDMKAQALALRAYVNFMLVNIFAQPYTYTADASHPGIPLLTSSDWRQTPGQRATVAQVYNAAIEDLTAAIPLFKTGARVAVRMNRNAAKALLARVYLYKGDFTNARSQARDVSATVPLMTAGASGYPSKLFTPSEQEALFQLPPENTAYTTLYAGVLYSDLYYFVATADIGASLFAWPSDLRKSWVSLTSGNWSITKFPKNVVAGFSNPGASYYLTLLRSSEMYLTAAEAYAQLNNEDSARYFVNAIRSRAAVPVITNAITGAALLDSIYTERRRELCFEGTRMFDLQRWKKGVSRTDCWGNFKTLPYPSDKAIAPLPPEDVDAYGYSQNPGY